MNGNENNRKMPKSKINERKKNEIPNGKDNTMKKKPKSIFAPINFRTIESWNIQMTIIFNLGASRQLQYLEYE